MNKIWDEYFTLNSAQNVDKGNGVAIFCAIVAVFACSYSMNMGNRQNGQASYTIPEATTQEFAENSKATAKDKNSPQSVSYRLD